MIFDDANIIFGEMVIGLVGNTLTNVVTTSELSFFTGLPFGRIRKALFYLKLCGFVDFRSSDDPYYNNSFFPPRSGWYITDNGMLRDDYISYVDLYNSGVLSSYDDIEN